MDRLVAALIAGVAIGFASYAAVVLVTLMAQVVPLWQFAALVGGWFILSLLYDIATAQSSEQRRDGE